MPGTLIAATEAGRLTHLLYEIEKLINRDEKGEALKLVNRALGVSRDIPQKLIEAEGLGATAEPEQGDDTEDATEPTRDELLAVLKRIVDADFVVSPALYEECKAMYAKPKLHAGQRAHPSTEEATEAAHTLYQRIDDQRDALFGAQALIQVAHGAIDPEGTYCNGNGGDKEPIWRLWRVLGDADKRLDEIATELDIIASDSKKFERE